MTTYSESWLVGPQRTQFYTRTYHPASAVRGVVVFVHGFIEHIARYEHVFPAWSARDIAVFAYDQRGFGRTALDSERKSKNSSYAKTSWKEQLQDLEWAIGHAKGEFGSIPLFLYGHSMGGALVLALPTREHAPPSKEILTGLAGVIATSPLILQAKPAAKAARWIGGKASLLMPSLTIPADVNSQDISHDEAVGVAYMKDPMVKPVGSLRGISDMLDGGEHLLRTEYTRWPTDLPVLLVHGSDDKVTSAKASELLHQRLPAKDRKISIYEGGYHELHNEPDGVKEKLIEECIAWVEAHLSPSISPKL
ncbi:alpha/beta-hydrolase [Rhizopogon vinicolor AM-OR11-026]|uniref:Alpha/beta-hydrolase n=1 Tax=Rhizopogon vinicolor AM-OR11-026 TaxID=1314800 RepID=A0A1B7N5S6_9AGAM|nr:alpha/beta-hydrolase [Rhizopogon vinicolor AM-OR11-026]